MAALMEAPELEAPELEAPETAESIERYAFDETPVQLQPDRPMGPSSAPRQPSFLHRLMGLITRLQTSETVPAEARPYTHGAAYEILAREHPYLYIKALSG